MPGRRGIPLGHSNCFFLIRVRRIPSTIYNPFRTLPIARIRIYRFWQEETAFTLSGGQAVRTTAARAVHLIVEPSPTEYGFMVQTIRSKLILSNCLWNRPIDSPGVRTAYPVSVLRFPRTGSGSRTSHCFAAHRFHFTIRTHVLNPYWWTHNKHAPFSEYGKRPNIKAELSHTFR